MPPNSPHASTTKFQLTETPQSESFSADYSPQNAEYFGLGNDASVHGTDGPLENVGFPRYFYNVSHQWFEGMNALDVPTVPDPATGDEKGAMFLPYDTNTQNQTRADARRSYYEPFAQRENLYVSTRQRVTRLLFEGGCDEPGDDGARAVGVEVSPTAPHPHPSTNSNLTHSSPPTPATPAALSQPAAR